MFQNQNFNNTAIYLCANALQGISHVKQWFSTFLTAQAQHNILFVFCF